MIWSRAIPRRWLAAISVLFGVTGVALGQAASAPPDPLAGLQVVHEANSNATYYYPRIDVWPQPDVLIYPIVAQSGSGARILILRVVVRDAPAEIASVFRLVVDGTTVTLPLDHKGAVVDDEAGCRRITKVTLGDQEPLIRQIAAAKDVGIVYGGRARDSFTLREPDFERARRMLKLFESPTLPPADEKPRKEAWAGPGSREGDPGVNNPVLIMSSKVQPQFPPKARAQRRRMKAEVTLEAVVRKDGTVGDVRILRAAGGDCGFEEASMAAVKQWKYKPGTRNGQPVDVYFTIVTSFEITDPSKIAR